MMNVASFVDFMGVGKSLIAESELQSKHVKCIINTLKFVENNAEICWYSTMRELLSKPVA